jgi:hypothetical protein
LYASASAALTYPRSPLFAVTPETSFGFHQNLEVWFGTRVVADFCQHKRIDMACGGDEVQVAADAGLGRVDIAEIVRTVDDPEFLVSGREIENLLVIGRTISVEKRSFARTGTISSWRISRRAPIRLRLARVIPGRRLRPSE